MMIKNKFKNQNQSNQSNQSDQNKDKNLMIKNLKIKIYHKDQDDQNNLDQILSIIIDHQLIYQINNQNQNIDKLILIDKLIKKSNQDYLNQINLINQFNLIDNNYLFIKKSIKIYQKINQDQLSNLIDQKIDLIYQIKIDLINQIINQINNHYYIDLIRSIIKSDLKNRSIDDLDQILFDLINRSNLIDLLFDIYLIDLSDQIKINNQKIINDHQNQSSNLKFDNDHQDLINQILMMINDNDLFDQLSNHHYIFDDIIRSIRLLDNIDNQNHQYLIDYNNNLINLIDDYQNDQLIKIDQLKKLSKSRSDDYQSSLDYQDQKYLSKLSDLSDDLDKYQSMMIDLIIKILDFDQNIDLKNHLFDLFDFDDQNYFDLDQDQILKIILIKIFDQSDILDQIIKIIYLKKSNYDLSDLKSINIIFNLRLSSSRYYFDKIKSNFDKIINLIDDYQSSNKDLMI